MAAEQVGFDEAANSTWIWPLERKSVMVVALTRGDGKENRTENSGMAEKERLKPGGFACFKEL